MVEGVPRKGSSSMEAALFLLRTHLSPSSYSPSPPVWHPDPFCSSSGAQFTGLDFYLLNDTHILVPPPHDSLITLVECRVWVKSFLLVRDNLWFIPIDGSPHPLCEFTNLSLRVTLLPCLVLCCTPKVGGGNSKI